jgi:hypothetical protein
MSAVSRKIENDFTTNGCAHRISKVTWWSFRAFVT